MPTSDDMIGRPVSTLEFRWVDTDEDRPSSRFLDFVIDGDSLYELLGREYPSALGWGPYGNQVVVVDELLLRRKPEHEFPEERQQLYICALCGDIYCGAVTATITRDQDCIIWKDFAFYQPGTDYDPDGRALYCLRREGIDNVGPFVFDAKIYTRALESALEDIKETLGEVEW